MSSGMLFGAKRPARQHSDNWVGVFDCGEGVVIFVLDVVGGVVRVLVGVVVVIVVVVVALVVRQRLRARLRSHRDADAHKDAGAPQGRRR